MYVLPTPQKLTEMVQTSCSPLLPNELLSPGHEYGQLPESFWVKVSQRAGNLGGSIQAYTGPDASKVPHSIISPEIHLQLHDIVGKSALSLLRSAKHPRSL